MAIDLPVPRRAVWCSAHHWESAIQVSAHQHARQLARAGWDVLFLSTPVTPFHLAATPRSADHRARFRAWHRRGQVVEGVRGYTPLTVAPLSMVVGLKYRSVLRHWQALTVPLLRRDLRRLGYAAPDLLVIDTPLYRFLLDDMAAARSVYRLTDFNPGFASATPQLEELEREAASRSDVTVVTAPALAGRAAALGAGRTEVVSHGVDVERFATPVPPPPEYRHIPAPRAVYVGSLREWFDFDLLNETARAAPDLSFVVVGPEHWARDRFAALPNLHVLGERSHQAIPAYLQHAAVGLIPFDRRWAGLVDATNPLKLYEYAAARLPVVSTPSATIEALGSPALLASTPQHFLEQLRRALADSTRLGAEGASWASTQSWSQRSAELLAAAGCPI